MTEQEKRGNVIKALELCTSKIETRTRVPCEICPYHNKEYHGVNGDGCCNMRSLQRDMLALLKAQEPVDAVPVEWLIKQANNPERAPLYRRYAQMLYEEWQKEQEAR